MTNLEFLYFEKGLSREEILNQIRSDFMELYNPSNHPLIDIESFTYLHPNHIESFLDLIEKKLSVSNSGTYVPLFKNMHHELIFNKFKEELVKLKLDRELVTVGEEEEE